MRKVIISGGTYQAAYIIEKFSKMKRIKLAVINYDQQFATHISETYGIGVYVADPTRVFVFEEIDASDYDVFISLDGDDVTNLVSCVLAKKAFQIKKTITIVKDPKNVALFEKIGVDTVISSTFILGQTIENETQHLDKVASTLALNNDKIVITEFTLKNSKLDYLALKDISFPKYANISAIIRNNDAIIPNGQTVLKDQDKLLIITNPHEQEKLLLFLHSFDN